MIATTKKWQFTFDRHRSVYGTENRMYVRYTGVYGTCVKKVTYLTDLDKIFILYNFQA